MRRGAWWVLLAAGLATACGRRPSTPPDAGGCPAGMDAATQDGPADGGAPSLASLAVTRGGADALVPAFSPDVHDYYVACQAGDNALSLSMKTADGARASLAAVEGCAACLSPPSLAASSALTLSLDVPEGDAVVIAVTDGAATGQTWIRCLPHDFPALAWTPHDVGCARPPGYYLFGSLGLPPGVSGYAVALDAQGVPVWYRRNGAPVYDVESLLPGDVSFGLPWQVVATGNGPTILPAPTKTVLDPHELRVLPDGHYLTFSSSPQTGVDLTGLTLPLADGGVRTYGTDATIASCDILEFEPDGTVVWTWKATDHFDPVAVMTLKTTDLAQTIVEPFHCNSLDVEPSSGDLLVSARNMSSVFYVEKATGTVRWKLGGADSSRDDAVYVPVTDPFLGQHDARFQPGWSEAPTGSHGSISVFDDQTGAIAPSRAAIYDVVVGATRATSHATLSWQYKNWMGFTGAVTGSFRLLPDGSRVIGWGQSDPPGGTLLFTEVDARGNDLVDMLCPDGTWSYRAVKVPTTALSLAALRASSE